MIDIEKIKEAILTAQQPNILENLEIIPIKKNSQTKAADMDEILRQFDTNDLNESHYILKIKSRDEVASVSQPVRPERQKTRLSDGEIYENTGKINFHYLDDNAKVLLAAKEYALAKNIYQALHKSGDYPAESLIGMGRCAEGLNAFAEAQSHYENSIAYRPTFEAFQQLITLLTTMQKYKYATEMIERAFKIDGLNNENRFELFKAKGNCHLRIDEYTKAEESFVAALEIDASSDEVKANLGTLYLQTGNITQAKQRFSEAIRSNKSNAKAYFGLGCCSLTEKNFKQAHEYFARSLVNNIHQPRAVFYLVKTAFEIKYYGLAEKIVKNYIEISPVNSSLLYSLAGMQYHLKKYNDCRKTVSKVLSFKPDHKGAIELKSMLS